MKEVYSTSEVAKLCHVTAQTVVNWIDTGKLTCMKTGGGFRKVFKSELMKFMEANNIPFIEEETFEKILIIDDNHDDVSLIEMMLRSLGDGFEIDHAYDGEEGLFKIGVLSPALVILDIRMPKLDGFKVYEMIKSTPETADIEVLFVTGQSEDTFIDRLKKYGSIRYMSKPLEHRVFLEVVNQMLHGK